MIDEEITHARLEEKKCGWITYLIRDPRYPDKKGNLRGTPIYVGQSKGFGKRVNSRFSKCEREATAKDNIAKRVANLLKEDIVVRYDVLERVPTHLSSLVSETNWTRECVRRGYNLANQLPFQNCADPAITRHDLNPDIWIWPKFSLVEAIEDNISLELVCRACGMSHRISFEHFQQVEEPPTELYHVKANGFWRREPCTGCGTKGKRHAKLHIA
jgi:hypothetical protein